MNSNINVVGVRFRERGKIYSFDASDIGLKKGENVIVNTENGLAIGTVVTDIRRLPRQTAPQELKSVVRQADEEDMKGAEENRKLELHAFKFCSRKIKERVIPMKLVDVECLFDRTKIIFYFIADNRVDFRELVKDLVQKFKTRIELRQIWVRSEARMCGGIGMCGREICCAGFLNNFVPVSVKMAKEQNMLLNPEKISGLCGRLMCCLAFEYDCYARTKKKMPKYGKVIDTPAGRGKVIGQDVLGEKVIVALEEGKEIRISLSDIGDKETINQ